MIPVGKFDEVEFRKKMNKKNTLRAMIKDKKALLSKLSNIPECTEEYFKVKKDIAELEFKLSEL